ncbi:extracellular solute-binding protein [Arthrobacter sp. StoSoilB22]|uniref:ABC transporter substrate-binding protein n=1 Tax=Arthrobacter sp. StoSoilB22 TaxID=2830996 RepID=UPI001CC3F27B|nr:extracellular solute-binding protein [Arthrobacter sp. StoSoilB22]BCW62901.1 ABC transporter substrate-binding protein [Arthrobacter sp. StoSoilB22]
MKIHKGLVTATVATLTAISLAGCVGGSGNAGTNNQPTGGEPSGTLTGLFFSGFKDTYEQIAADFKKKYPNVDVKFDYQGGDVGALTMTQLQGGTAPDILTSFPGGTKTDPADTVVSLAASGRIAPIGAPWAKDVPDAWKKSVNYEDKTFAYPGALQPLAAIFNKTKIDELGLKIPTTLDEVYGLCTAAKSKGVYAYSLGLGDPAGPQMLTYSQLGTLEADQAQFDADLASGKKTYADSVWVDQFEIYKKMGDQGCFGEGALGRSRDQAGEEVAKGSALATVDVGAALAPIQKKAPNSSFEVAPMPATNNAADTKVVALPGFVNTINAKAKNPTAAQAFLAFMGEAEPSVTYANGFASVPVLPNDAYKAPKELTAFADLIKRGAYQPLGTVQAEVQAQLNQTIQSLILGQSTPRQVAEKLDSVYKK